ncbi:hypothetical protein M0802_002712 [Mischocyttarus mexicanus]|nr:hypothetical protein M0802_002712 [Mischocyttarus mexicanus]
MPSRGSYQIANQDERKVTQRDQSFKNCVATLFVFFILLMFVLIANLTWKKSNIKDDDKYLTARQHSDKQRKLENTATTTIETTTDTSVDIIPKENISDNEQTYFFSRYSKNKTKEFGETNTLTTLSDSISTLNNGTKSTDSKDQTSTIVEKIESTEQPNYYSYITGKTLFENDKITENEQDNSTTGSTIIEKIIRDNINETETDNQISTTVYPNISTEYESSSNDSSFDQINSVNNTNTSTEEPNNITTIVPNTTFPYLITSELSTVTDITKNNDSFVKSNITDQFLTSTIVYEPIELTSELTDSGKTSLSQMESTSTEKAVIKEEFVMTSNVESNVSTNNNICNSGHCKQIAARILSYMNHSADPCEDFYEYACGGMIANPQIIDLSLEDKAYHRIAKQMLKDNGGDASSLFTKYYNSCMQYENIDINERIKIVNEAIKKIGRFYAVNETFENHENFTNFYVKLLKTYNPLLFDVALDPEDKPDHITIRVGPVLHKNLFNDKNIDDSCYASETETQEEFVDLEDLYEKYSACKENNAGFIQSIKKALKILGVFNDSASMHEDLNMIGFNINEYLVNNFFSVFPHENKIREAYLQKRYYEVSIDELNKSITFINWYDLKSSLTSKKVNAKFQVYFYEDMKKGLHNLETFRKDSPKDFHNAVLALYAQKLYQDLIIPKHKDMKEYCLKVSINLLEPEASNLYMSSLSDKEITLMSHKIKILFDELKNTLQLNIQNKTWIKNEQRQVLLSKLNDLKLSVPEVSYFQYEEKYKLNISDNYLENSLNLMKRYRSSIYSEISLDINNDITKEIWTHYATPFQSKGIAIYNLNLIIIPFGAIDYGGMFMSNDENSFNYLTWATIGNLIARQIFHHFDSIEILLLLNNGSICYTQGIYYSNLTRDTYGNTTFEEYLTCHEDNYSKEKKNIILPHTSQTISYNIPELTLNERLSEIMGLRLTYDTFKRQQSFPNSYLPWLEPNINQLFYLIYAQMYCTKSLLTTSYISLHENEELPSRIRVFISASNNNLLGGTWNCPEGSQILPSSTCDDFPHLIAKDQMNHDINFS